MQVIRPEYEKDISSRKNNVISIPFNQKYRQKWFSLLERVGWYEDYLDLGSNLLCLTLKN